MAMVMPRLVRQATAEREGCRGRRHVTGWTMPPDARQYRCMNSLPRPALWLGLAGLLPFLASLLLARLGPYEVRGPALLAMASYGAVILSFLGAVHWGFALSGAPAENAARAPRLAFGVLPALLAWLALLMPPGPAFLLLGGGILATAAVETWAARHGLVPRDYLRLRWVLSLGAASCLLLASFGFGQWGEG